jgi:hypothetical protein
LIKRCLAKRNISGAGAQLDEIDAGGLGQPAALAEG